MSAYFPNGYKLDSPIELMRLRNVAADCLNSDLSISDEELTQHIATCGTHYGGKVYIVETMTEDKIKKEVHTVVADGTNIIFYSEFYERNRHWLFLERVVSEDMLIDILEKLLPKFSFKKNYFSPKPLDGGETSKISDEIIRIWGDDTLLSYNQITERLPYIPIQKLKAALTQNDFFIWDAPETYTHMGKFEITDESRTEITRLVSAACRVSGYVSLDNIPIDELVVFNHTLSITAVHTAVYKLCLEAEFRQSGKIVAFKHEPIDVSQIMADYCRSADRLTLDELLNFQEELIGKTHTHHYALEAGYSAMIRLNKNVFISDRFVNFDSNAIDDIIEIFLQGEYLPLGYVTTFATFPHCGQPWSLYLLESYCRRYSIRYRFESPALNSKNAGVIVRKTCNLKLGEIFADAVVRADIQLNKEKILDFLYDEGYIGRRSYAKINELIECVRVVRERKD